MSNAALILLRAHLDQLRQGGTTTVPLTASFMLATELRVMKAALTVPVGHLSQRT